MSAHPLEGMKIMVIDDSSTIRRSAEIFLLQAGCRVVLAEDGFGHIGRVLLFQWERPRFVAGPLNRESDGWGSHFGL